MANEKPPQDKTDAQRLQDVLERIARALERTATRTDSQNEMIRLGREVTSLKAQRERLLETLAKTADAFEQATQGSRGAQARPRLGSHPVVREAREEIQRTA